MAATEVRTIVSETLRLYPDVSSPAIFYYLNLPHSEENGQVFVINNGLGGALWAGGYDRSVLSAASFASTESHYQQLVEQVLSCTGQGSIPGVANKAHVLVYRQGHLVDCSGTCAEGVIKESIASMGSIWQEAHF
jgi:hypothetical protein